MIRIVSWNVNGLRAILKKGFISTIEKLSPDILCLQEVKADLSVIPDIPLDGYQFYFNPATRRGYSGTAMFIKTPVEEVQTHTPMDQLTEVSEGRVILATFPHFHLVNVYTPNSGSELARLPFRHHVWDPAMLKWLLELQQTKPVILCGDMNVAHQEIDLAHPEANHFSPGFTDEEREGMSHYLQQFGVDTFRHFYPDVHKKYSWWSYRMRSRERNIGWRIDYVITSPTLIPHVQSAFIWDSILGSDHAPVGIDINL